MKHHRQSVRCLDSLDRLEVLPPVGDEIRRENAFQRPSDVVGPEGGTVVEGDPVTQVKNVGERVRNLPSFRQPGHDRTISGDAYQAVKDQLVHSGRGLVASPSRIDGPRSALHGLGHAYDLRAVRRARRPHHDALLHELAEDERLSFPVEAEDTQLLVLIPLRALLLGQSYARVPKVAGMVSRWLVTWERRPSYDDETASVWAAFVDVDGTTPGEFGIATNQVTSEYHYAPAVATSPALAVIVWEDTRLTHGEDWNIYARRVRIDGLVYDDPDGFEVAVGPADERNSAIGWNGSTFQVAYEVTEQIGWFDRSPADVYGSRIDQYGVSEPTIQRESDNRILVQLPGVKDPDRAVKFACPPIKVKANIDSVMDIIKM